MGWSNIWKSWTACIAYKIFVIIYMNFTVSRLKGDIILFNSLQLLQDSLSISLHRT